MNLPHLKTQYDRLSRHRSSALSSKDEISFLDLAHALRIWVDMKSSVTQLASERNIKLTLRHYRPQKFIKKGLGGAVHISLPLASGVSGQEVEVRGVRITNRALSPEEIRQRAAAGPPIAQPTEMTFSEWLGADAAEFPSGGTAPPHVQLSREIIIKRIANRLGASHPMGMSKDDPKENRFDPYIHELHSMQLSDFPATYYLLLEISGELLARLQVLRDSAA